MAEEAVTTTSTTQGQGQDFGEKFGSANSGGYELTPDEQRILSGQPVEESGESETPNTPAAEPVKSTTNQPEPVKQPSIKPEVQSLMEQYATELGVDLKDPLHAKTVRMIAERENLILEGKKAAPPVPEAKDYLDRFRDPDPKTKAESASTTETTPTEPTATRDEDLPEFVRVAKSWQKPEDFVDSLDSAFELPLDDPKRKTTIASVFQGFVERMFQETLFPRTMGAVESMTNSRFEPVIHEMNAASDSQVRRSVVDTLATDEAYADIMDMFEPVTGGTITVEGEQVADTWLNRVIAKVPDILDISVKGKTPAESKRLTIAKQYRAAHSIMRSLREADKSLPADKQTLINTGKAIAKTSRPDPDRQGLNKSGEKAPSGGRESIFAASHGDGISMRELFK